MSCSHPRPTTKRLALALLALFALSPLHADADQPGKKRVKKSPAKIRKSREVAKHSPREKHARPRTAYVKTRRSYRHVRVREHLRHDDGRLKARPIIIRSARVTPIVLERFKGKRHDQIRLVIDHLRNGHRDTALHVWSDFVGGLADYGEPVDLDEVMLLIAREGSSHEDDGVRFHARKLAFLRSSGDHLREYVHELIDQQRGCRDHAGHCSSETMHDLEMELHRARTQREKVATQIHLAGEAFDAAIHHSSDYASHFASLYDGMYREVQLRIRITP